MHLAFLLKLQKSSFANLVQEICDGRNTRGNQRVRMRVRNCGNRAIAAIFVLLTALRGKDLSLACALYMCHPDRELKKFRGILSFILGLRQAIIHAHSQDRWSRSVH